MYDDRMSQMSDLFQARLDAFEEPLANLVEYDVFTDECNEQDGLLYPRQPLMITKVTNFEMDIE